MYPTFFLQDQKLASLFCLVTVGLYFVSSQIACQNFRSIDLLKYGLVLRYIDASVPTLFSTLVHIHHIRLNIFVWDKVFFTAW